MAPLQDPTFKTLTFTKLHPTFGAEVSGVDFTQSIPNDVFQEMQWAMAKVGCTLQLIETATDRTSSTEYVSFEVLDWMTLVM